jgi:DNA-binding NtrC family response regulator
MSKSMQVLVVDDNRIERETLVDIIESLEYKALHVPTAEDALNTIKDNPIDLILTDLKLPKMNGLELLAEVQKNNRGIPVILVTGYESVDTAIAAMKNDAQDYLVKPLNKQTLQKAIESAIKVRKLYLEKEGLKEKLDEKDTFLKMIANSPKMIKVINTIKQVAKSNATILINGESGTGKELVAESIYQCSKRVNKPFVKVNLAALPLEIIESELFGHEKGSFTGAVKTRKGRFELADEGTLFLDEVSEMPLNMQVKLLRVLQEQEFERVGSVDTIKTDIRFIAATNKNLIECVKNGTFREDLYYRLNVVVIDLPPLRERKEDIPAMIKSFLKEFSADIDKKLSIAPEVVDVLLTYHWPGNVRQLRNIMERLTVTCIGERIELDQLPDEILEKKIDSYKNLEVSAGLTMDEIERRHIINTLKRFNGKKNQAAKELNIGLKTLYRKIERYGIEDL